MEKDIFTLLSKVYQEDPSSTIQVIRWESLGRFVLDVWEGPIDCLIKADMKTLSALPQWLVQGITNNAPWVEISSIYCPGQSPYIIKKMEVR